MDITNWLPVVAAFVGGSVIPLLSFYSGWSEKRSLRTRLSQDAELLAKLPEGSLAAKRIGRLIDVQARLLLDSITPTGRRKITVGYGVFVVAYASMATIWYTQVAGRDSTAGPDWWVYPSVAALALITLCGLLFVLGGLRQRVVYRRTRRAADSPV